MIFNLHWIDIFVILAYLAGMAGMGWYFMRRQNSASEFLLANREVGWLAIGLSLLSSLNSANDYIVGPATFLEYGFLTLATIIPVFLTYPVIFYVFIPFYQKMRIFNCYEYLERRFDMRVRLVTSFIFVLWRISWVALTLYAPAYLLTAITDLPLIPTIIVLGVITTLYTTMGGARAVVWTDVVQSIIMFVGLIAACIIIYLNVPGGWSQMWQIFWDTGPSSFTANIPEMATAQGFWAKFDAYMHADMTFMAIIIIVTLGKLTSYGADQVMVQRYLSARSLSDCKNGFFTNTVAYLLYSAIFTAMGIGLYAYFQLNPLPPGSSHESMFPWFIANKMPVVMKGLIVAAVYSAGQSSVSAGLSATTTVVFTDFYLRLFRGKVTVDETATSDEARAHVWFSRICTVCGGVMTTALACYVPHLGRLIEAFGKLAGCFSGMIIPIFLLGMFTRRANSAGVAIGAIAGLAVMFWWNYWTDLGFSWAGVAAFFVVIFVGYGASLFERRPAPEKLRWQWGAIKIREAEEL